MVSPGFSNTVDSDSWQDDLTRPLDEQDFPQLRPTLAASPYWPLPGPDLNVLSTQFSLPSYPPAHGAPHLENFEVAPPNPNTHTLLDSYGWPLQTDLQSLPYCTPFVNPQDSGPVPTTHQPFAAYDAGRTLIRNDFQGYSSPAMNGSFPVHDPFYSPQAQSHNNGFEMFVGQTMPCNSAVDTPHLQIHPAPASVVRSPSFIPSDLASQHMVSRFPPARVPPTRRDTWGAPSVKSSPYHRIPVRKSSLPVQPVSPEQTAVSHACQWMMDDGTPCGTQITHAMSRQHFRDTHGIKNMTRNTPILCRWLGCRPRGDKDTMNRESILRHILEHHLGRKRPTKRV